MVVRFLKMLRPIGKTKKIIITFIAAAKQWIDFFVAGASISVKAGTKDQFCTGVCERMYFFH